MLGSTSLLSAPTHLSPSFLYCVVFPNLSLSDKEFIPADLSATFIPAGAFAPSLIASTIPVPVFLIALPTVAPIPGSSSCGAVVLFPCARACANCDCNPLIAFLCWVI